MTGRATWRHPDRVLIGITKLGTAAFVGGGVQSDMPGFGDRYSDDEIRDVIEWIKSTWPAKIRAAQAEITAGDARSK
ncbi:MAG: cytochrome c [Neomegalonema sp.]|nr:cytochrome c [Neomegalonema sp.]